MELNNIYNIDCLEGIKQLKDNSINLVVTSPPYNVDLGNNKYNKSPYNLYNDNKEHKDYIAWLKEIFSTLKNKLTDDGRIVINIGDGKNGAIATHSDIIQFMKELNYIIMTQIIWNKSQIGSRTSWGSYNSPSCPSFPTPFEYILVFANKSKKLLHEGETDLTDTEFVDWSLAIWEMLPEVKMKRYGHPAMFPEELARRSIKMFSYIGDTVLDIFSGMGTTCYTAKILKRNYIGFELSKEYCNKSLERIDLIQETLFY